MMMNRKKSPFQNLTKHLSVLPLIVLLITPNSVYAQLNEQQKETTLPQEPVKRESKTDEIFVVVEQQPEFIGGTTELMKFLSENIVYPSDALIDKIEGRVIVNFVINKDGDVSDVNIVRGINPSLDSETLRVISLMPNWKPGLIKGEKVRVRYTLPIVFRIPDKEKDETRVVGSSSMKEETSKTLTEKFGVDKHLIIIDGVKMEKGFDLNSINRDDIDFIAVLKMELAIAIYGEEGKDGAVVITKGTSKNKTPAILDGKATKEDDDVFEEVEVQPEFPGGIKALIIYLGENIKYQYPFDHYQPHGRVITNFIIHKDGSISNINIIRGIGEWQDKEATRVIKNMPKWTPGQQGGKAVNVRYTLPIVFRLQQ